MHTNSCLGIDKVAIYLSYMCIINYMEPPPSSRSLSLSLSL